jgi:hypothetical protein
VFHFLGNKGSEEAPVMCHPDKSWKFGSFQLAVFPSLIPPCYFPFFRDLSFQNYYTPSLYSLSFGLISAPLVAAVNYALRAYL